MEIDKKFFITTAIAYPNGKPHIGHAYEYISTDAIARFKRLDGYQVFYLTGTDEHGQKIAKTAAERGITPQELVDENAKMFQKLHASINSSYDRFIRTTEKEHAAAAQHLWTAMEANGDIYLDKYAGWYSIRDEAFFTSEEVTTQPDGTKIAIPTGNPVEWNEEESYFFRLSNYREKLIELYQNNPTLLGPTTRLNEILGFLKQDLHDLSISRSSFQWGIPVPGNNKHVMYVWTDALTNYLTGVGYPDTKNPLFKTYWPADLHIIGKDIVRFHAVYWPAFLMSAGITLPNRIFAHGFLFNRGEKMSKSTGNVIDPEELLTTYGVDPVRYFLLREIPYGQDGNYSHAAIINRTNTDLANEVGNLLQRTLTLVVKNCDSLIPTPGSYNSEDQELLAKARGLLPLVRQAVDQQELHLALETIWKVLIETNRYISAQAPWALRKTDIARMQTVLYVILQVLTQVGILLQPFIPESAAKLLDQLKVPTNRRSFADINESIKSGTQLEQPEIIFPRILAEE